MGYKWSQCHGCKHQPFLVSQWSSVRGLKGALGVAQLCPLLGVPTATIQESTVVTPPQGLRNIVSQARSGWWSRPVPWGAGLKCFPRGSLARAGLAPGGPPAFRAMLSPRPLQQGWVESLPCEQSLLFLVLLHLSGISQRKLSASRGPTYNSRNGLPISGSPR